MSDPLPGLKILAIGGSIAPPLLLLTILLLISRRPLANAGALALGYPCSAPCRHGWGEAAARSRSYCAWYSEGSSSPEASWGCESMALRKAGESR
jgi:hypothetical protein